MRYTVCEVHKDGKTYERFISTDRFECEVYVAHHKYDYGITRSDSRLIVKDDTENIVYDYLYED